MEEPNTQTTEIKPAAPRAKITTARLENLIAKKDAKAIQKLFIKVPDIDIAEAANALTPTELIFIFRCVESKYTADFFDELDQSAKEHLVKAMTDKELVTIVNTQAADDVTDTVGEMPANLASKVLKAADKDMRKDINYLLNYKENTAGSIMTTEYIELLDNLLVDDAIDKIRDQGKDAETIYTIFVRDAKRNFVGTVDLDDLIFAKKNQTLHDIMNQDVVSCLTSTDQEEVGQMFRRYDLNALAVLNDDRRLVGIITIDDAVDVMTAEATEDIEKLGALTPAENNDGYLKTSPAKMAWRCIPWLIILLVMGTLSSLVLSQFDEKIAAVPLLASFLPVLMDGGGNSGGQTTTLMVRGLALKEFEPKQFGKVLWKEFRTACLVGLIVGVFGTIWFLLEQYMGIVAVQIPVNGVKVNENIFLGNCWNFDFFRFAIITATVTGCALCLTIIVAKVIAVCLPLGVAALKKDPALMSEPLLTTVADVAALLIYFGLAEAFIIPLMNR
jgi:magnesium transporter